MQYKIAILALTRQRSKTRNSRSSESHSSETLYKASNGLEDYDSLIGIMTFRGIAFREAEGRQHVCRFMAGLIHRDGKEVYSGMRHQSGLSAKETC